MSTTHDLDDEVLHELEAALKGLLGRMNGLIDRMGRGDDADRASGAASGLTRAVRRSVLSPGPPFLLAARLSDDVISDRRAAGQPTKFGVRPGRRGP